MIATKKLMAVFLAVILLAGAAGCAQTASVDETASPEPTVEEAEPVLTPTPEPEETPEATIEIKQAEGYVNLTGSKPVIGFVVEDDGQLLTRCSMHGFLRTAENLSYPSRIYRYEAGSSATMLIDQAYADGCKGLIIWAESQELVSAANYASQRGMEVVIARAEGDLSVSAEESGAKAVLSPNPDDYCAEAVRLMCETTISRGNTTGVIVVAREAGAHQDIVDACQRVLDASYPDFVLQDMPLAATQEETEAQAKEFINNNRNIVGVLGLSPTSATAWYNGEVAAEKEYDFKVTPVIMGLDYTDENISLVANSKIYCLIARPYYTSAAQAMMVMDSLLHGVIVQEDVRVNAPMIRKKDIEKYSDIVSEVKEWFEM